MNKIGLMCALVLVVPAVLASETHHEVQAALDYTIPPNECKKPKILNFSVIVETEDNRATPRSDVDSYTMNRMLRKEKRWKACVKEFKQGLMQDLAELRDSAQHGLSQEQADMILKKMADIQSVYLSPDGIKPAELDNS